MLYSRRKRVWRNEDGKKSKAQIITSLYVLLRSMTFILSIIGSCGTILNRGVTNLCFRNIYHNYIMISEVWEQGWKWKTESGQEVL